MSSNRNRLLALLQILEQDSDEQHPLTTAQVRKALADRGITVSINTLRDDVESLQASGYQIEVHERNGTPTTYGFLERDWDASELQILIDAVSSAQFIPQSKSEELIRKLVSMAGPSQREELKPQILMSEHIKAKNKKMIYTVQAIRRAIKKDRQISFKYLQYKLRKEEQPAGGKDSTSSPVWKVYQEEKYKGTPAEEHIVSPYATIWNNDRYYMVGYSEKLKKVATFRIDRMDTPKQVSRKRIPEPEDYRLQDYTEKVFWMFGGYEAEVTLRCQHKILDQVVDRFGEELRITNVGRDTFDITVPVRVSGTFYAWVLQFVGEMTVVKPEEVRTTFAEYLQDAIDDVLGN